jgi:hypothetical protein
MASGSQDIRKDPDGSYFIDRDGNLFHYILSFLRGPEKFEPPADPRLREAIWNEASYFRIVRASRPTPLPLPRFTVVNLTSRTCGAISSQIAPSRPASLAARERERSPPPSRAPPPLAPPPPSPSWTPLLPSAPPTPR